MDYIDHLEERTFVLNELGVGVREVLTNYGDVLSGPEPTTATATTTTTTTTDEFRGYSCSTVQIDEQSDR